MKKLVWLIMSIMLLTVSLCSCVSRITGFEGSEAVEPVSNIKNENIKLCFPELSDSDVSEIRMRLQASFKDVVFEEAKDKEKIKASDTVVSFYYVNSNENSVALLECDCLLGIEELLTEDLEKKKTESRDIVYAVFTEENRFLIENTNVSRVTSADELKALLEENSGLGIVCLDMEAYSAVASELVHLETADTVSVITFKSDDRTEFLIRQGLVLGEVIFSPETVAELIKSVLSESGEQISVFDIVTRYNIDN